MWPFYSSYPTSKPRTIDGRSFDYIIAGGGTAGCALAAQLSEDPHASVLLIERGAAVTSWLSRIPLATMDYRVAGSPSHRWWSQPLQSFSNLTNDMVTGKALGGTSKINSSIYHRSVPADFNSWGEDDWSWSAIEPVFKKAENSLSHGDAPHRGASGWYSDS
jgi:choline dehydrogenase